MIGMLIYQLFEIIWKGQFLKSKQKTNNISFVEFNSQMIL